MFFGGTGVVGLTCPLGAVHSIETARLRLVVARRRELVAYWDTLDEEARRWVGVQPGDLGDEPDGSDPLLWHADRALFLGYDPETGQVVSVVTLWRDAGDHVVSVTVGAPWRRRGYGAESLALVCAIAHRHLGIARLHAGSADGDEAAARCLSGCGFGAAGAPALFTLPSGRVIEAQPWERTEPEARLRCRHPPS
ncbi:GNAT family protein [Dactylosporangium sp. NPDC005572]|uniref:GNAT family N-acetyltransferase n=1 Tax=Dactylosporangium sp. NPDC005572 TaxID=3156889 RepID=UPI00339E1D56